MNNTNLEQFEEIINYRFKDAELLKKALPIVPTRMRSI